VTYRPRTAAPVAQTGCRRILAKLGRADAVDQVVATLIARPAVRRLYLTAVLARVLARPWPHAASLAAALDPSSPAAIGDGAPVVMVLDADAVRQLAAELGNPRDGAARWCAAVALAHSGAAGHGPVRSALHRALQVEQSRQNLRAIGVTLAGASPLTG